MKFMCDVFDIGISKTANNEIIISAVLFFINKENNLIEIKEKNSAERYQYVLNRLDTFGNVIVNMQYIASHDNNGTISLENLLLIYSFIGVALILSKLRTNPLAIINKGI